MLIRTCVNLVLTGSESEAACARDGRKTKEVSVATLDERHTRPNGAGPNRTRWIAIVLVAAAIAAGVVLLVLYGGGGSSGPY
ncbi:MAG: hypothetical protein ACRDPZ_01005 [Gaiellaceae bacterium]